MASLLEPTRTTPDPHGRFPVLISYAFARKDEEFFKRFVEHPGIEVLLDSGAFTALNAGERIELPEYMEFLERWKDKLFGYLALDVLGDPAGTDRNLETMLRAGLKPIPVHVRGDGASRMDQLFGWSDWVALGGLRRPHVQHSSKAYVKQKMVWAKGRDVHWLGYTNRKMVLAFKPYSIDCSNWAAGARWGDMHFYYGDLRWGPPRMKCDLSTPLNRREVELFAELELTPADVRNPRLHRGSDLRRNIPFMITAWSWVRYARDLRARVGTRAFHAVTPFGQQDLLLEMIDRTTP